MVEAVKRELEGTIHSELYRIIKNVVEPGFRVNDIVFTDVEFNPRLASGKEPDLVIKDSIGNPQLVIETKKFERGKPSELFDPFSSIVIRQAYGYADELGAPYFATCNREELVLFKTFEKFIPLPERNVKHYDLPQKSEDLKLFVETLLKDLIELDLNKRWTPSYQVLIARFRSIHKLISPHIYSSLKERLKEPDFKERYTEWLEKEGFEYSEDRNLVTAKETAYLLIDKIIFYRTLQKHYKLPRLISVGAVNLKKELDARFDKVTHDIDYVPVFERSQLFDQIPLSQEVMKVLDEFILDLDNYEFENIGSDIMGQVYRDLIPKDEKKEFGQYCTDADICEMIVKLCIHSPNDVVLDPGCGSGTFLIKAYQYLKAMKNTTPANHTKIHHELLEQLWGVEINQFPAHLSVMQLTMQDLEAKSNDIHVLVNDFFKAHRENILRNALYAIHHGSKDTLPEVDDVIGNPPYIKQQRIKGMKAIRQTALMDSDRPEKFSEKSDDYIYFFMYGLHFLKKNGKFGFITSNTWLDANFGQGFKDFLLKRCQIDEIIYFDKNVFEDALVNTSITILTKKDANGNEPVKFIRIKRMIPIDDLVKLIRNITQDYDDENVRIVLIKQKELHQDEKWGWFIKAPPIFNKLRQNKRLTVLSDKQSPARKRVAEVKRCYTTNADKFFILPEEEVTKWGIEPEFLVPVIKSPKELNSLRIDKTKIKKYLMLTNLPKSRLSGKNILSYIKWGEERRVLIGRGKTIGKTVIGYHNIPSLKNKKIWYDLGNKLEAPILMPKDYWIDHNIFYNPQNVEALQRFYAIIPTSSKDTIVTVAYLNSSLNAFFMELYGRILGGRGLDFTEYEIESLPIINPEMLSSQERKKLEEAFEHLLDVQDKNGDETTARSDLDEVIFEILNLSSTERKQVHDGLKELKKIREGGLVRIKETKLKTRGKKKEKESERQKYTVKSLHHWMEK